MLNAKHKKVVRLDNGMLELELESGQKL